MGKRMALMALLLSVLVPFRINAQTHYDGRIWIGARAGASFSRLFFNPSVPQSFLPGAEVGFSFRYCEEKHFGIVAELNFRQAGWKETFKDTPAFCYNHTLNYLQLPVFTHIYFGSEKARFFFNAGPSVSVLLGGSVHANFDYCDVASVPGFPMHNRNYNQYKLDKYHRLDYGISAGLGGEINVTPQQSLDLEVRFYYGLGNAFPSGRTELFNSTNGMSLSVTAGYWFRLK